MNRRLVVADDVVGAVSEAAARLADALERAARRGRASLALSGGHLAAALCERLAVAPIPWARTDVFQVDERVVPAWHPARTATVLRTHLGPGADRLRPMPVDDPDLEAAAARYAAELPFHLDVVHLGIGGDGHTASLFPDDPVLDVRDRAVVPTGVYRGHRRVTLTAAALGRARLVVWLAVGGDKAEAVAGLLAGDPRLPAARVATPNQILVVDRAAAS